MTLSLPTYITPGRCIVFLICLSLTIVLLTSPSKPEVEPLTYHDSQFIPRQNPSSIIQSLPIESKPSTTPTTSQVNHPSQSSNPASNPTPTPTTSEPPTSTKQ